MPRIDDTALQSVIYLYDSEADAAAGTQAGGSGFQVSIPIPRRDAAWIYAITNRHVTTSAPVVRVNHTDGTVRIFPFRSEDWVLHPDGTTDLAAVNIDIQDPREFQLRVILPDRHFITREMIQKYDAGVGDDTALIGRFVGRDGVLRNLPSVRAGVIAQMPDPAYPIDTEAGPQEAYLIESRSIAGYSGSPIFIWIPSHRYYRKVVTEARNFDMLLFLGIGCAHLPEFISVMRRDS